MNHPTYLFIGSPEKCKSEAIKFMCKALGEHAYDLILNKKHSQAIWISPDKNYVLEDLKPIFHALQFKLDANQHFFLILENIDMLSLICAQSLLKSLEEPPQGYHFLLLGQKKQAILPTIFSRCLLMLDEENNLSNNDEIFQYFTDKIKENNYSNLSASLSQRNLDNNLSNFLDSIYSYWLNNFKESVNKNQNYEMNRYSNILEIINLSRNYMPLTWSSNLFVKNLYLQIKSML